MDKKQRKNLQMNKEHERLIAHCNLPNAKSNQSCISLMFKNMVFSVFANTSAPLIQKIKTPSCSLIRSFEKTIFEDPKRNNNNNKRKTEKQQPRQREELMLNWFTLHTRKYERL